MNKELLKFTQGPCTEMIPTGDIADVNNEIVFRAITMKNKIWRPGSKGVITVNLGNDHSAWSYIGSDSTFNNPSMNLGFLDPPMKSFEFNDVTYEVPPMQHRNHCGIYQIGSDGFDSIPCPHRTGDVRSEFDSGGNKVIFKKEWVPGATVIHEFGHALGMMHEHQNNLKNSNPIQINTDEVLRYYTCTNGGDSMRGESDARNNVLNIYSCVNDNSCEYDGTEFDDKSIMLYPYPNAWIKGCTEYPKDVPCSDIFSFQQPSCDLNPTKTNFVLSPTDISWLKKEYPPDSTNPPEITIKFTFKQDPELINGLKNDPEIEKWKVAWVQKVVTETFCPILGIKWIFDTKELLGEDTPNICYKVPAAYNSSEDDYSNMTTTATTVTNNKSGLDNGTKIFLWTLLAFICLFVVIGIARVTYRSVKKSGILVRSA